ncbi:MAG: SLC13 family permease [Acidobacteriota bacterium]
MELFQIYRNYAILDPVRDQVIFQAGDEALIKASAQHLAQILESRSVVLSPGYEEKETRPHDSNYRIVELLVQPNSNAIGQSLGRFMESLDAHIKVLGVNRHWKHYPAGKVRNLRLGLGDIILVQTPLDHLDQIRAAEELMVIEDVHKTILNKKKAPLAMGIFLLMIAATTFGISNILVSAMTATLLMILTGCISLREAYRSLDPKVLILIIGTIALGNALSVTGAADLYADLFLKPFAGMSPYIILSAFILLTSLLSLFLSNNSTAVLLMPIALSTASVLGVDPRAFIVGLCFGASACYATPIGYQTNLLVYGPGGYVFKDYLKLGIPLTLGVWIVSSICVPLLWPL